jgi:FlaA1/EpsC-like NDP-sugar epimerase
LERWKVALGDVKGRVAVVGAGEAGRWVVEELRGRDGTEVVAVFDGDARRWHGCVAGIRVVGMPECLLNAGWRDRVDTLVLTENGWTAVLKVKLQEKGVGVVELCPES